MTVADFPLTTSSATDLALSELATQTFNRRVAGAGHPVTYDPVRRQWFADITVRLEPPVGTRTAESWFPFVRLALARFQPHSLPGVEVSRVVIAELAQLTPDRSVTVAFPNSTLARITVAGSSYGATGASSGIQFGPTQMFAVVHHQRSGVTDPDLGWDDAGSPVPLHAVEDFSTFSGGAWTWQTQISFAKKRGTPGQRRLISGFEVVPDAPHEDTNARFSPVPGIAGRRVFTEICRGRAALVCFVSGEFAALTWDDARDGYSHHT